MFCVICFRHSFKLKLLNDIITKLQIIRKMIRKKWFEIIPSNLWKLFCQLKMVQILFNANGKLITILTLILFLKTFIFIQTHFRFCFVYWNKKSRSTFFYKKYIKVEFPKLELFPFLSKVLVNLNLSFALFSNKCKQFI